MNLQKHKALFIVVTAVLALLVVSPALEQVLVYPQSDFFTEVWLLSSGHTAHNYPYNIVPNENYSVFLDIANHLGSLTYYVVEVKFSNETESAPDSLNFTPSNLPSLFNITVFVTNKETWELPVTFVFNYSLAQSTDNVNIPQVIFNSMTFNGVNINLSGLSSERNPQTDVFYGNLFFELWIYNSTTNTFQYNDRFVNLLLNTIP